MADREKKERKTKIQEVEYLENEKSFLNEIKKKFSWFLKGYHLMENKNLIGNSGHKLSDQMLAANSIKRLTTQQKVGFFQKEEEIYKAGQSNL